MAMNKTDQKNRKYIIIMIIASILLIICIVGIALCGDTGDGQKVEHEEISENTEDSNKAENLVKADTFDNMDKTEKMAETEKKAEDKGKSENIEKENDTAGTEDRIVELETDEAENMRETSGETFGRVMDYDDLHEQGYGILKENILENPISVYENPWLCEQEEVTNLIEDDKELQKMKAEWLASEGEEVSEPYTVSADIDYFLFDFNDDGTEEYIISASGSLWAGTGGNLMMILEKNKDGNLESIFTTITRIHNHTGSYSPVCVLENKINGYYTFILPETYSRVWWYNTETGRYEDGE